MMRIITGSARGVRLDTLEGEATRPTSERAKQAIFNVLQFDLEERRVLDLFAGSGQLALEALSRGASFAYLSDSSLDACAVLKRNAEKTRLTDKTHIACCDFRKTIRNLAGQEPFSLIFLDPPYQSSFIEEALTRLTAAGLIAEGGYVVCESDRPEPVSAPGLTLYRRQSYGRAVVTILKKEGASE